MNFTVRCGRHPFASAMRSVSVRTAMPDASSSAPGASWERAPPALALIESRCAPSTTTSSRRLVPWMVRMTDGCVEQPVHAVNSSVVTSPRPAAMARQWSRIQSADERPVALA